MTKRKIQRSVIIGLAAIAALTVCVWWMFRRQYNVQQPDSVGLQVTKQHEGLLLRANQALVQKDDETIRRFAETMGWTMKVSPSGLRYEIYRHGTGAKIEPSQTVEIVYTLSLADSAHTVCYSSDELGLRRLRLGQKNAEEGLEEALLMMSVGDKAHLILPPHLAHGLSGDGNRIPRRAIVVYDVEVKGIVKTPSK